MKKGIVMEKHRKFTIVMTQEGLFEKAHPITNAEIGFEVNYEPFVQKDWFLVLKENIFTLRVVAMACIFLVALLPLYLITSGNEAYAYIDIDINPSIELEIDNELHVSNITPYNDDAKLLLAEIGDLKGKEVQRVIEIIMSKSEEKGLINTAKNVLIGVYYLDEVEKDPIMKVIEDHFAKKSSDWQIVTVTIPEEVRDIAIENQESMNKVLAKTVANEADLQIKEIITEEDSEVLQSFFNKNKTEVEITNQDSSNNEKSEKPTVVDEKINEKGKSHPGEDHPSELKGENGEINSNKNNNGQHNGKANGHNKDKQKNPNAVNNKSDHNNGKNKNNHPSENGKNNGNKDKATNKDKKNQPNGNGNKGNNNKENKKEKNNENKNKGNNGNGKGNNHNGDISFGFPTYK